MDLVRYQSIRKLIVPILSCFFSTGGAKAGVELKIWIFIFILDQSLKLNEQFFQINKYFGYYEV